MRKNLFTPLIAGLSAIALSAEAEELASISALDPGDAQIVLLGEVHDNPAHHETQASAVAAITPSALVFEMLTPEQAEIANKMERDDPVAMAEALDWTHSSWPDFALYYPILAAAPQAPIFGAAIARADLMHAMELGAAEVFGDGAERYGLGPLPAVQQKEREAFQLLAHCNALPEEMLGGMVAAQRLRDASFSATALDALEQTGGPVVVITGNGHARLDWGMPVYLAAAAPDVRVMSVGQFEAPFEEAVEDIMHDVWLVSEAAEREDPCAVFDKKN